MNNKKTLPVRPQPLKGSVWIFLFRVGVAVLLFLPSGSGLLAQEKEVIALNVGGGVLTFHGDVGTNSLAGAYSFIRSGFSVSIEKYLNKNLAISATMLKGKVAREEKSSDNLLKLNFESPIMQLGLSGTFILAGKNEPVVKPFLSAGFSYVQFDPHGDLLDKSGNSYYYWKDGSIKDLPETGLNYFYAQNIDRDYKYETQLKDSTNNYSRSTFALPLSFGVKFRMTTRMDANIAATYHMTFSDYLDNVSQSGKDAYLFTSASLTFHIFTLPKKEREQASQLFAEMDKADSDKDGILDDADGCPGTPGGVKVDTKGCPLDADNDGVPDYLDKEKNSKAGVLVDASGVELTKARLKELSKENDGIASSRRDAQALSEDFNKKPSAEFMRMVEEMQKEKNKNPQPGNSTNKIPNDLLVADWNKDGFISSAEIAKTIDSFFDGSITFSVEQVNRLIDYFFEQ